MSNGTFEEFFQEKNEWSLKTFGTPEQRGPMGPIKHLELEIGEIKDNPGDLMEYVDCIFLIFDAAYRAGFGYKRILAACWEKLAINKARRWPPITVGDEPQLHLK